MRKSKIWLFNSRRLTAIVKSTNAYAKRTKDLVTLTLKSKLFLGIFANEDEDR